MKFAAHAHDRIEERTPFHRSYVNHLQLAVDSLGLTGAHYHVPLRNNKGAVVGFAQFRRVPNRANPVLTTVLGPNMSPKGQSIEQLLNKPTPVTK